MTDDVASTEGTRLIKRWEEAKRDVERAKSRVNSAECDLLNATNDLAKWMLPEDAKPGEKICVWHIDALIQVEVGNNAPPGDHQITIRKRGREYALHRAA